MAGADAADVSPRHAARCARACRKRRDRRGERDRSARSRAEARARRAGELQADLSRRFRARRSTAEDAPMSKPPTIVAPQFRIGEGWDTHALVAGRPLVLGGVEVPHTHGLLGHSDADALCHAITDALFGAAALGDIGHHFPETDAQYRGADSLALLSEATRRVRGAGWQIGNVDLTVIAQAPRLGPHLAAMRQRLAG